MKAKKKKQNKTEVKKLYLKMQAEKKFLQNTNLIRQIIYPAFIYQNTFNALIGILSNPRIEVYSESKKNEAS